MVSRCAVDGVASNNKIGMLTNATPRLASRTIAVSGVTRRILKPVHSYFRSAAHIYFDGYAVFFCGRVRVMSLPA